MENKVILGDCLDVMKDLEDESIDFVFTDPPYGLGFDIVGDGDTLEEQKAFTGNWLSEAFRLLKPNGTLAVFSGDVFHYHLYFLGLSAGLTYVNTVIWHRWPGRPTTKRLCVSAEFLLIFTKGIGHKTFNLDDIRIHQTWHDKRNNPKGKNPGTVWYVPGLLGRKSENIMNGNHRLHPTQKPVGIIRPFVLAYTNIGDTVFDPFMGVGTIPWVAKSLERKWIGIDIDAKFVQAAENRLQSIV